MRICWVAGLLALALAFGGCSVSDAGPQPEDTPRAQYLTQDGGLVTLRMSALLGDGMSMLLKRGSDTPGGDSAAADEVLLNPEQARALFAAVDAIAYGDNPQPMPTGAKGYLWAVRVSAESTDEPLFYFFLDMDTRATVVVLEDGAQHSVSMEASQGQALEEAFAEIAAQAGMRSEMRGTLS